MRTIIAGSRTATEDDVNRAMDQCPWTCDISIVISGKAKGADLGGEKWAKKNGIPIEEHPADWNTYGRSAGYIRNTTMGKRGEALVAVWDGVSKGTKNMIDTARKSGLRVFVYYYKTSSWTIG